MGEGGCRRRDLRTRFRYNDEGTRVIKRWRDRARGIKDRDTEVYRRSDGLTLGPWCPGISRTGKLGRMHREAKVGNRYFWMRSEQRKMVEIMCCTGQLLRALQYAGSLRANNKWHTAVHCKIVWQTAPRDLELLKIVKLGHEVPSIELQRRKVGWTARQNWQGRSSETMSRAAQGRTTP